MEYAIEIKNVGKKYSITHHSGGYLALRDIVTSILRSPLRFLIRKTKQIIGKDTQEEFWALKNINFGVAKGEVIGIIGSNGAGKSTLLKILTGITPPTTGEIKIRGKIASLLEVGTGFHPELTGRENVFLNGAILGMTRKEILSKMDRIIEFAGVKKFLDTPVKYYSSGMYVRLAFSVAAHMEPDILLVDEVLAVGDAEFQKKCLGKMDEVSKTKGRTILFVSHNMSAIQKLCTRSVLLHNGEISMIGETKKIIETYRDQNDQTAKISLQDRPDRKGSGNVRFTDCQILSKTPIHRELTLKISYLNKTREKYRNIKLSTDIISADGIFIANNTNSTLGQTINLENGAGEIILNIYNINLGTGKYHLNLFLASDEDNSEIFDWVENVIAIEINNDLFYKTKKMPPVKTLVLLDFEYRHEKVKK